MNTGFNDAPEGKGHMYEYEDSDPWLGYRFVVGTERGKFPTISGPSSRTNINQGM